jgi:cell division protein FtsZ
MVFITCGMGGGTGTGASSVLAELAQEVGALSVAVVTKPFTLKDECVHMMAEKGINELKERVDTLITIPNDRLLHVVDKKTPLIDAFRIADNVLQARCTGNF